MDITHLPLTTRRVHYLLAGLVALVASGVAGYLPARKRQASTPSKSSGVPHDDPTPGEDAADRIAHVTKTIGDGVVTTLVRNIDIAIEPGEFVAITGPSGSG